MTESQLISGLSACDPYAALLEESQRVGWPERFQSDLTEHDRQALARQRTTKPFAWVLMRSGTYLVAPSRWPIDGAGHHAEDMPKICEQTFGKDHCRFYWWDGERLGDVGGAHALAEHLREAGGRPTW